MLAMIVVMGLVVVALVYRNAKSLAKYKNPEERKLILNKRAAVRLEKIGYLFGCLGFYAGFSRGFHWQEILMILFGLFFVMRSIIRFYQARQR